MKKVIIAPYARKIPNVKNNPKNYPWWQDLVNGLKDKYQITQIGINGENILSNVHDIKFNLPLREIKKLLSECYFFITVDSFLHHLAILIGKRGVVIYGHSDPEIFGNAMHINILKDKKYLRQNQFGLWSEVEYDEDVFVKPGVILKVINDEFSN